jgi:nuclease HARBI1
MGGRISKATTQRIIRAVTDRLCELAPLFIKFPRTAEELARTKQGFYRIGSFPQVLGAVDGTHINLRRPAGQHPAQYLNRHHRFSMNIMAVCDADLRFTNVYADFPGANHDAYIWANSPLSAAFRDGTVGDGWLLGK